MEVEKNTHLYRKKGHLTAHDSAHFGSSKKLARSLPYRAPQWNRSKLTVDRRRAERHARGAMK